MNEIAKVFLENEMDLILANRQSMRLAELTGLSLAMQTTFATAVSEVARNAIERAKDACLTLYINVESDGKYLVAVITDTDGKITAKQREGYDAAKKLVSQAKISSTDIGTQIELQYRVQATVRLDEAMMERFRIQLNTDPAVSPYEEIKRKNRQLLELAEKLKESEQLYRHLADSLPILLYSVNKAGELIYANKWLQDYTGSSLEELNEKRWQHIIHPDDYGQVMQRWERHDKNESYNATQRRLKNVNTGEYRWHSGIATIIPQENEDLSYWNVFMVDIHDQKLIEQTLKDNKELRETQKKLEEKITELNNSNEQLEQFAYIASHDLQEPLRKIGFYSDYLKHNYKQHLDSRGAMFLDNMLNATERMKALIRDVLSFSTIDNKRDALVLVDLNTVAHEALQDLEMSIAEKQAVVNIGQLPAIEGIAHQLRQLFENLFSNSIKYVEVGTTPVISVHSSTADEGNITISVTDNGIGFEMDYLNKMFGLFQRLHSRDQYAGTGIGLPICKKIVENHKGSITAQSTTGHGATFIITLPVKQPV